MVNEATVAGNGLLHRRMFLKGGLVATGSLVLARARADERPSWQGAPGRPLSGYGQPAGDEGKVVRGAFSVQAGTAGSGASRSPLQHLQGTITPNGLHFERHHAGVPEIDPARHTLVVHGMVERPLRFSVEDLLRYPMVSRFRFLECSGNSAVNLRDAPALLDCAGIHGLVSGSEWTGIPLRVLLDEAGVDPAANWVVAEGADAPRMHRSIPMAKMRDDAIIALYQNGERLRPEQGYPLRLFLPGYEGNASVKWLHSLHVARNPAMSRQETAKYTDLMADGRAAVFTFPMGVKSVITSPSPGLQMDRRGYYEISGIAWSGHGAVRRVEVSADGGASWAEAALDVPVLSKALTRFRLGWHWNGAPCVLKSRAYDERGMQPTRSQLIAERGENFFYHYNAIQSWQVDEDGTLANSFS